MSLYSVLGSLIRTGLSIACCSAWTSSCWATSRHAAKVPASAPRICRS